MLLMVIQHWGVKGTMRGFGMRPVVRRRRPTVCAEPRPLSCDAPLAVAGGNSRPPAGRCTMVLARFYAALAVVAVPVLFSCLQHLRDRRCTLLTEGSRLGMDP